MSRVHTVPATLTSDVASVVCDEFQASSFLAERYYVTLRLAVVIAITSVVPSVALVHRVELFRNIFTCTPCCTIVNCLGCEENTAKIFATVFFRRGRYVQVE